jgi:hypothetical protein
MRVRPAESLEAREILEQTVRFPAVEWLVDAVQVGTAMQQRDGFVEAFKFFSAIGRCLGTVLVFLHYLADASSEIEAFGRNARLGRNRFRIE